MYIPAPYYGAGLSYASGLYMYGCHGTYARACASAGNSVGNGGDRRHSGGAMLRRIWKSGPGSHCSDARPCASIVQALGSWNVVVEHPVSGHDRTNHHCPLAAVYTPRGLHLRGPTAPSSSPAASHGPIRKHCLPCYLSINRATVSHSSPSLRSSVAAGVVDEASHSHGPAG